MGVSDDVEEIAGSFFSMKTVISKRK